MTGAGHSSGTRERAAVVHPVLYQPGVAEVREPEARLAEAEGLAAAIDLDIAHAECVRVGTLRPGTLMGRGVVDRLGELIQAMEIGLVVVDAALTPVQQRNLERAWKCKVIDRTALILEIFGARARTREGRLQVDLAHLSYQRSRLVRSWTHLERQRGGGGFMGGPGETQVELDRRLIDDRIAKLKRELEEVRRTRDLHRRARKRVPHPVVALVGYTNAGKSTLFNRLTEAEVLSADMLFATLDPTMRGITLPSGRRIILSDTVGFISDLPTHLVAAFRATLEEVQEADLLLHVRDVSHPDTEAQKADVELVLKELGLEQRMGEGGCVEVLNKMDLLPADERSILVTRAERSNRGLVAVSALTGEGCGDLLEAIDGRLAEGRPVFDFAVPVWDGKAIAWLYDHGEVLERRDDDEHAHLTVRMAEKDRDRFQRMAGAAWR